MSDLSSSPGRIPEPVVPGGAGAAASGQDDAPGTDPVHLAASARVTLPFVNTPDAHIFTFRYEGPERPLHDYLLERYAYGRDADWATGFYPHRVRLSRAGEKGAEGVDSVVDSTTLVGPGDKVRYLHLRAEEPEPGAPIQVLHEDPHLLGLLKDDSTPVNPSGVYYFTCLALRARDWAGDTDLTPLHRLDLETSGPVLFARVRAEIAAWHRLFQEKTLRKRYRALVHGRFPEGLAEIGGYVVPDPDSPIHTRRRLLSGVAGDAPLEAGAQEPSMTRLRVLRRMRLGEAGAGEADPNELTELEVEPVTGKTNQIRVALAHVGHPIVGDKKYHPDPAVFLDWIAHRNFERLRRRLLLPRQALHCAALAFRHPFTGQDVTIKAPPEVWAAKLAGLPPGAVWLAEAGQDAPDAGERP